MQRQHLVSDYRMLELHLRNVQLQPNTAYTLELDVLGGELYLYLLPKCVLPEQGGVLQIPFAKQWTTVRFSFTTVKDAKLLAPFTDWGICFLKTLIEQKPRSCIYTDSYVDNVRLFSQKNPDKNLLQGGTFEQPETDAVYDEHWRPVVLGKPGKSFGVSLVTDPLNAKNHCLHIPPALRAPRYPKPLPLQLQGYGWQKHITHPVQQIDWNGKPYHQLFFIKTGTVELEAEHQTQTVTNGDMIYIPPHTAFSYNAHVGENTEYYWLHINGDHADTVFQQIGLNAVLTCHLSDVLALTSFVDAMLILPKETATYAYALSGQLQLLLNELERQLTSTARPTVHRVLIESVATQIRLYPNNVKSNALLAQDCGLSQNYFIRLFKEVTGMSPQQYRIHALIKRACTLLQDPSLSIKEIALSLGFEDPLYFSRVFRSAKGISPRDYRKQWQDTWGEHPIS